MSVIGAVGAIIVTVFAAIPVVVSIAHDVKDIRQGQIEIEKRRDIDSHKREDFLRRQTEIELEKLRIETQLAERKKQRIEIEQKVLFENENQLTKMLLAEREAKELLAEREQEDFEIQQSNTTNSNVTVNGGTNVTINGGTNTIVINNITK